MKTIFRSWFRTRKNRIRRRLDNTHDTATCLPVFSGRPIDYEVAHRHRAIAHGGIGAIHMLAHRLGLVVIRKRISREKGDQVLSPEVRYFFYLTNNRVWSAADVVFEANDRCNQENLLAQLHGGVRAFTAPVNTLESNGAWMVMTALAWNLKAWWALLLPESPGRWQAQHREEKQRVLRWEFKSFVNTFVTIPCLVIQSGGQLVLRVLGWNPELMTFFRLVSRLRQ